MRCVRLITLLFFLYVDYLSLFCTSSFAVRAHSGSRPFTNALQRLIESAASWSDDYCYVCLWYSYTQDRPSVQMLDLISREVPLNRYVDYRDIHRDVDSAISGRKYDKILPSIGGFQYLCSSLLEEQIATIIRSPQFQEDPDGKFSDVPIEIRQYVVEYFGRNFLATHRTRFSCLNFSVSNYSSKFGL